MGIIDNLFSTVDSTIDMYGNTEVSRAKVIYAESLFEKIGDSTRRDYVDSFSFKCTNKYLSSFYNNQLNKYYELLCNIYPSKYVRRNFMGECIAYTYEAIIGFDVLDGSGWSGILDGTDKANIKRLVKHIKKTVKFKILREIINYDKQYTKRNIDDKKEQHVVVKLNIRSLDNVVLDCEGQETTLNKIVSDDQRFIFNKDGHSFGFFKEWLDENKDRILSNLQLKYLASGLYERKMHNRICDKLLRELEKENPFCNKSIQQIQKEREIEFWTQLIDIIYTEDENQNSLISDWIISNIDNDYVSDIVYALDGEDVRHIVSVYASTSDSSGNGNYICSKILYRFYNLVEDRLDQLQLMEIKPVRKFYKTDDEIGYWTLDKHKEYEKYRNKFKSNKGNGDDKGSSILVITPTGYEYAQ